MTVPRLFSPEPLQASLVCRLGADQLRYLKSVLRLKPGDPVRIFDGFGHEYEGVIEAFSPSGVDILPRRAVPTAPKRIHVTLAQAVPKASKMDTIAKGAAEMGADVLIPFMAARSVTKLVGSKGDQKVIRWRKIVQEAARCTQTSHPMHVSSVETFPGMLVHAPLAALKLIFWEAEERTSIKSVLQDAQHTGTGEYFIIVGPEGGFTRDEVMLAIQAGFVSVSLGRHILKVETAGMAILAMIQYEKGIFSQTDLSKEGQ